jgi:cobyrinic acid a,c-diamide synthase
MARVVVVAGVASGVGKTTITLGLLEAYRRRGLAVQAFKVGPDFIDPGLHELVTGRPSYNLDGWMCGRAAVRATVARAAADADLAVVEGMMGCFDGIDGTSEEGSTAQVAKWLEAPVLLVLDAAAQSRSAGAVALGFERFDPALRLGGVVANRAGGPLHARWLGEAIAGACRAPLLGAVPGDAEIALPERHLGLHTAAEGVLTAELRKRLADAVESAVDLDRVLSLASPLSVMEPGAPSGGFAAAIDPGGRLRKGGGAPLRVKIAVARDVAFQFYYRENLELLRAAGAELRFWSPLEDRTLPEADGLYLGGGYPELHARRLAANRSMLAAVERFCRSGRPVYAECGGLMYLARALEDADGETHELVGVLPATVRMRPRRLTLGYTEVRLADGAPLGGAGAAARGHEFHASTLDPVPASVPRVYRLRSRGGEERAEGFLVGRTLMSYVHLHFASNPGLARAFVESCAA